MTGGGDDGGREMTGVRDRLRRDPNALVLGGAIALATIIIGAGIAIYASASPDDSGRAGAVAATGDTERSTTTSSRAATSSTAAGGSGATTTTAAPGNAGGTAVETPGSETPQTPRATADPDEPPFETPASVPGATATLAGCVWEPANGGELQAWGTVTSFEEDGLFGVNVHWLQNDRELDWDFDSYDFGPPGQTLPWRLTVPFPVQPLDLRCVIYVD
jgi:hypothetical protein